MDVRIEEQTHNRNANNGQQNAAGDFQLFQTENNSQPHKRHNHREGIEIAQRDRQAIQRVFNDQADAVGGNQQQKQANTDTGSVGHALRQVTQNPATNAGGGDNGKQYAHQEYGAKRDRDANMLPQDQAKRGKRRQRDSATDSQRQIRPKPHNNRADACDQAGRYKDGSRREPGFTQHPWHHDDGVNHRKKRG